MSADSPKIVPDDAWEAACDLFADGYVRTVEHCVRRFGEYSRGRLLTWLTVDCGLDAAKAGSLHFEDVAEWLTAETQLDDIDRDIIQDMTISQRMSHSEIAKASGWPENTIKKHLMDDQPLKRFRFVVNSPDGKRGLICLRKPFTGTEQERSGNDPK